MQLVTATSWSALSDSIWKNNETDDLDKALPKKLWYPSGRSSFWWENVFRLMCLIQSTKKQKERVAHTVPWNKRRQTQTMRYPRSLPFRWHWTDYPLLTTLTTLFKLLKYFLVTIHGTEYKNARQIKLLK